MNLCRNIVVICVLFLKMPLLAGPIRLVQCLDPNYRPIIRVTYDERGNAVDKIDPLPTNYPKCECFEDEITIQEEYMADSSMFMYVKCFKKSDYIDEVNRCLKINQMEELIDEEQNSIIAECPSNDFKARNAFAQCFANLDPLGLKFTRMAPTECGYSLAISNKQLTNIFSSFVQQSNIPETNSMCTMSAHLGFLEHAKYLHKTGKITYAELVEFSKTTQKIVINKKLVDSPWYLINMKARPSEAIKLLGGTGSTQKEGAFGVGGLPKAGDLIQIWWEPVVSGVARSGHAAIFEGFTYDKDNKISSICYFSSQESSSKTGGYGRRCSNVIGLNELDIGHFP